MTPMSCLSQRSPTSSALWASLVNGCSESESPLLFSSSLRMAMKDSSSVLEWNLASAASSSSSSATTSANARSNSTASPSFCNGFTRKLACEGRCSSSMALSPAPSTIDLYFSIWAYESGAALRVTSRWKPLPYRYLIWAAVFCTISCPFSMTQIQSVSFSASSRWWVVRMIVLLVRLREANTSHTLMRLSGSSPEVGSSKISRPGLPKIAMAIESFLLLPPDSSFAFFSLSASIPRVLTTQSMCSCNVSPGGTLCLIPAYSCRCWSTVSSSQRTSC